MLCLKGDLFAENARLQCENGEIKPIGLVCTINRCVNARRELVMGAGIALAFKQRWPKLPALWGSQQTTIKKIGSKNGAVTYDVDDDIFLIGIATKDDWRQPSTLDLVVESLIQLHTIANFIFKNHTGHILVPKLGCSNGGLDWNDVRPLMEYALDDRFVCCLNE